MIRCNSTTRACNVFIYRYALAERLNKQTGFCNGVDGRTDDNRRETKTIENSLVVITIFVDVLF